MPLVPAICSNCGGQLEVDPTKEAAICPFCNTPFITEKAIYNYNTTNVTKIEKLHADVVQLSDERSLDNRVKSGETFIKLGEYDSAYSIFDALIKEAPYDYRSWIGMVRVRSRDYTDNGISKKELDYIKYLYGNAKKVVGPNDRIGSLCGEYIKTVESNLRLLAQNTQQDMERAKTEYMQKVQMHRAKIDSLSEKFKKSSIPVRLWMS